MDKLENKLFKKYCDLVYHEAGINLTEDKRELLNARIAKRLRTQNVNPDDYLRIVQKDPVELRAFIDAVSTNHTFFFRESKSFEYLGKNYSNIWSAASSSGEEAYSIAMFCMEKGFWPSIIATDISDTCLEKGKLGIYAGQSISNIPAHILKAYFQKGQDRWQGFVKVKNEIRQMVNFKRFNLIKDALPTRSLDIIFCRNVMIYFDNPTKEYVVKRLASALRKGGYFIIGGAESLSGLNHSLKYIEPSVYLKN
jgi:chemotaxis protein methyltransferase CheR